MEALPSHADRGDVEVPRDARDLEQEFPREPRIRTRIHVAHVAMPAALDGPIWQGSSCCSKLAGKLLIHPSWKLPSTNLARSKVAEHLLKNCSGEPRPGPNSAKSWQAWSWFHPLEPRLARSRPTLAECSQVSARLGQIWPEIGRFWLIGPSPARVARAYQIRPNLARIA